MTKTQSPQFSPDQILALLDKHRLPVFQPIKGEFEGVVNEVWFAGEFVVRINKNLDYESDVWTESVAVPALLAAGIKTPQLIAFDSDHDIVDRLVTIYERAPGIPLSKVEHLENPNEVYRQLGEAVRHFHEKVSFVDDPDFRLDPAWRPDYQAARKNLINLFPESDRWLPTDLDFKADNPPVFTHQDLHADNILVNDGKLSAIIDWGDAGWGSKATDMRFVPGKYIQDFLRGYGQIDEKDRTNMIIHLVDQFAYSRKMDRSYGPYGDTTIDDIKNFLS